MIIPTQRRLIEPDIEKLRQLSMLTFNYLAYQKEFKDFHWPEDESKMNEYKLRLENWFNKNTEIIK